MWKLAQNSVHRKIKHLSSNFELADGMLAKTNNLTIGSLVIASRSTTEQTRQGQRGAR